MILRKWENLPEFMRTDEVKPYYAVLRRHWFALILKRLFDIVMSVILLILLSPAFLVLALWIKKDSPGPVFFRQTRITQYGKPFRIFKFRTMVDKAEALGAQVTVSNDSRITKVGEKIRRVRLDEIPQLINVLRGEMSFVGTRPEVPRYVEKYTGAMNATLLLPAGVTSVASIEYKDEDELLQGAKDPDDVYVNVILPKKMEYNLKMLEKFSVLKELGVMIRTVLAVI